MMYPYEPLVMPDALKRFKNGRLPASILVKTSVGGQVYVGAADSLRQLVDQAKKDKIVLKSIGSYRPYAKQLQMFNARFSLVKTGRIPPVMRKYLNKIWWLKKGCSPSAVPGTSNHGWGLAIDFDLTDPKVFPWLCKHGPEHGWYLQGDNPASPEWEAWHWQKVDAR